MVYRDIDSSSNTRALTVTGIIGFMTGAYSDLVALALLHVVTLFVVYSPFAGPDIIRLSLALAMMLFLPGYLFIAAVYPGREIGGTTRAMLSVVFSIILTGFLGFALDKTVWGISLNSMVILITLLIGVCMIIAFIRRRMLPRDQRFAPDPVGAAHEVIKFLLPASGHRLDMLISALLICSLAFTTLAVAYAAYGPGQKETFTELYVCGPGGKLENYPLVLSAGAVKNVIVGISNFEGSSKAYDLVVTFDDEKQPYDIYSETIVLDDRQTVNRTISLTGKMPYDHARVLFSLYMDGNRQAPYRQCYLLLNSSSPVTATATATVVPEMSPIGPGERAY